jgi:ribosomal protein L40E
MASWCNDPQAEHRELLRTTTVCIECFGRVPRGAKFCKNCGSGIEAEGDAALKARLAEEVVRA